MEKYGIKKRLDSYTIDEGLMEDLSQFFGETVSNTLSPDLAGFKIEENTAITLINTAGERLKYGNISNFHEYPFNNKIEGLEIELSKVIRSGTYEKAIVLDLSFNKDKADNFIYLALQDSGAEVALSRIYQKLLSKLDSHKNRHSRIYRNEVLPTLFFEIGAVCGTLTFAIHEQPYRSLLAIAAGAGLYLFAYIYIKGYSTFDSRRQRRLDVVFKLLTVAIIAFILAIIVSVL